MPLSLLSSSQRCKEAPTVKQAVGAFAWGKGEALHAGHLSERKGHEHAVGGADELLAEAGQVGHDAARTHLFSEGQRAGTLPVHFGGDEEHGFPGGHAVQFGDGHDVDAAEIPLQHVQHGHVEIRGRAHLRG